jgi:hypothetical protein
MWATSYKRSVSSVICNLHGCALSFLPDPQALSLDFLLTNRRLPRLHPPRTFNEKIIHRKLYVRDPQMPLMADKVLVKNHVASVLGPEWVIPTVWSGSSLPPRENRHWPIPYVLKANHGSGWNLFVRSEADQDWERIERAAERWLARTYGADLREWLYAQIQPQVLVEPLAGDVANSALMDFKVFVFGGKAIYVEVDTDRQTGHRRCFYDRNWTPQPFTLEFPLETRPIKPPQSLDRMLRAAELLSGDFSFVRVDFYEVEGRPLFGEITFYPDSGRGRFRPSAYDASLGELWPD